MRRTHRVSFHLPGFPMIAVLAFTLSLLHLLFLGPGPIAADDGPPADLGPTDVHQIDTIGLDQPILVIYVQADDYRILPADLAAANSAEDDKVSDLEHWFGETSWGVTTFNVDQQRDTGDTWYTLPGGILDYARPSELLSMERRDATAASASDPTPPARLTAVAAPPGAGDPTSDFDSDEVGHYWYAVAGFKSGVESTLTRLSSAVTVTAGDLVTLTIDRSTADVDRWLVYRTDRGQSDTLGNYLRIGYADASGTVSEFVDRGIGLDEQADQIGLLTDAMEAASGDVADFEAYSGVIVVLHSSFLRGQAADATTFTVAGRSFKIQTISLSSFTPFGRFAHEMGHWLGLPDEYSANPNNPATRAYWTTMDGSNNREYAGWEKDHGLAWIAAPASVKSLARPAPGSPDLDLTFKLTPTATPNTVGDTFAALRIESSASVDYYVEGRGAVGSNVSDAWARDDVVLMEAVDAWPPGIYPKRNLNEEKVLDAGDPPYSPDSTLEITYTGINSGSPPSYDVHVKLKAGPRSDPMITPWGAPPWETPDIWVDSEREGGGWDDPATATPKPGNGEAAWVDHVNRVFARVTNVGEGDATGVRVRFQVNTPGGMGDVGQFVDLPRSAWVDVPAGESRNVWTEWTPTVGEHTCIKVEIEHLAGEADIYNNFAQENVNHFYSGSGSPWHPVSFPVRVANPFDGPRRIDLEPAGLGAGWSVRFENKWVEVEPETYRTVEVTVTPPPDAERCTKRTLDLYAMTRIDDYIQTYGGVNPIIHLANPIRFQRLEVVSPGRLLNTVAYSAPTPSVYRLSGVTEPALGDVEIAVIVTDPLGRDLVYFGRTDATGAFDVSFPAFWPGRWRAYPYYAGDDCNAPTEGDRVPFDIPLPGSSVPGERRFALSFHLGSTHPLGSLDHDADANIYVALDAGYQLTERVDLQAILGLAQLTAESASGKAHPRWLHTSFDVRVLGSTVTGLRPYVRAGVGAYDVKGGSTDAGANVGVGAQLPLGGPFALEFGADLHQIADDADTRFVTVQLGVQFR